MQRPKCKCGCNKVVTWNKGKKKWNKFLMGHSGHKFQKGENHIYYEKQLSERHRKRISKTHTGKVLSEKTKQKLSEIHKGKKLTEKTKQKISKTLKASEGNMGSFSKGHSPWNKGKTEVYSEETKRRIGISRMRCRTDGYCDAWSDKDYKKECTKPYCDECNREKIDGWKLNLHHIDLDKTNCHPNNLRTLCVRCHMYLHRVKSEIL